MGFRVCINREYDGDVQPWMNWYHVMGHTYGTWLPGDPKGFRTRHHREHVEGDYKIPPPAGMYAARHENARRLMKRDPVFLTPRQRERALEELVISLLRNDIPVLAMSVDRIHVHALIRCDDLNPRHWFGIAKKESSHYCKQTREAPIGGLWAVRCKCLPIERGVHLGSASGYILDHAKKGAVTWLHPKPNPECLAVLPPRVLLLLKRQG